MAEEKTVEQQPFQVPAGHGVRGEIGIVVVHRVQQQLQSQTRNLFGTFPFPNFQGGSRDPRAPESPANDSKREDGEKK